MTSKQKKRIRKPKANKDLDEDLPCARKSVKSTNRRPTDAPIASGNAYGGGQAERADPSLPDFSKLAGLGHVIYQPIFNQSFHDVRTCIALLSEEVLTDCTNTRGRRRTCRRKFHSQ
jgi:hypothetical protein